MGQHGSGGARRAVARLRGQEEPPSRRWPWALLAAVLGAAAGSAAAFAVRTLEGTDAPDALEPDEVQAVVDRPGGPSA
jgi:hypothetical protein